MPAGAVPSARIPCMSSDSLASTTSLCAWKVEQSRSQSWIGEEVRVVIGRAGEVEELKRSLGEGGRGTEV